MMQGDPLLHGAYMYLTRRSNSWQNAALLWSTAGAGSSTRPCVAEMARAFVRETNLAVLVWY